MTTIPPSVIGTASPILADAYTHAQLNALFMSAGFPGDAPEGNKIEKCRNWLRRANAECGDALRMFGALIAEFMDAENTMWGTSAEGADARERIRAALRKDGLSYSRGGHIHGAALSGPSRSLAQRIEAEGIPAIEVEYERAYKAIESDPGAAVTAACTILESVCKSYLEGQAMPCPASRCWEHCGRKSPAISACRRRTWPTTTSSVSCRASTASATVSRRFGSRPRAGQELPARTAACASCGPCRPYNGSFCTRDLGRAPPRAPA